MRTTVNIPDSIANEIRCYLGTTTFSQFVRESVERRLAHLKRTALLEQMGKGYREEADNPSLDPEWSAVETEGL